MRRIVGEVQRLYDAHAGRGSSTSVSLEVSQDALHDKRCRISATRRRASPAARTLKNSEPKRSPPQLGPSIDSGSRHRRVLRVSRLLDVVRY